MRFLRRPIVLALLLSVVAFVAPIVPARAATDPTAAALDWLERELSANGHRVPSEFGAEFTDWGLTIDFILASGRWSTRQLRGDGRDDCERDEQRSELCHRSRLRFS